MKLLNLLISKSKTTLFEPHDGIHSIFDDVQGMTTGLFFMALGVLLFKSAGLLSGGVMGLALVVHYWAGVPLWLSFMLINLPFYVLSYFRMGKVFTLKSVIAVSLLSLLIFVMPHYLQITYIHPYFAGIVGGLLVGVGLIQIFRHRASTGGFNVLVLYLQSRNGWNAGLTQMVLDFGVIGLSIFSGSSDIVVASFLGALSLNFTISVNHRPGRYISF